MAKHELQVSVAVVVALATAAVATGTQFPMIQANLSDQYEALEPYPGMQIADLVSNHFDSTQERFLVYAELRQHARGASIVTFRGSGLFPEQLSGLAQLSPVVVEEYDPIVATEVARTILRAEVARGQGDETGPWVLAARPGVTDLVVVRHEGRLLVADHRLLDDTAPVEPA